MSDQILIHTNDKESLRPLLESAIERQKKILQSVLNTTKSRLAGFEERFGMTSDEFERRLNHREIDESVDFTDWRMEIGMLRMLEKKHHTLEEATIVG